MGWLNAIPEKKDRPRREEYVEGSPETELPFLSRYEQALVNYWVECGMATSTSGGIAPITWNEVDAWARRFHSEQYVEWVEPTRPLRYDGLPDERFRVKPIPLLTTQCTLTDWELQTIKRMSQEYVSEYSQTDPNRPCPKEIIPDEITDDDKLAAANSVTAALKSLFGADIVPAV